MSVIKRTVAGFLTAAIMLCGYAASVPVFAKAYEPHEKTVIKINSPSFKKISSKKIRIYWGGSKDKYVRKYIVQRADADGSGWKTIKVIKSDGDNTNGRNYYTDKLSSSKHKRYRYRIRVRVADTDNFAAGKGKEILASNVKVCVDPGHYLALNGGSYGFTEAEGVLRIGLKLREYLTANGIDVYMTRTGKDIYVGGETDCDSSNQLYARGAAAKTKKCDFFISLHTNANGAGANNRDTLDQPCRINKTIVFINRTGYYEKSKSARKISNYIGKYITSVNKRSGVYSCGWKSSTKPTVYSNDANFTKYNDGLGKKGKVVYRRWGKTDYYAVLRAASEKGVPGILVEHSYHTYPGFCKSFMQNETLAEDYAKVEAKAMLKYLF